MNAQESFKRCPFVFMMSNSRMPWLFTVFFDIVLSFLPVGCGFILGLSRVYWILFFTTSSLQGPLLNHDFGPRIEVRIFANKLHVFCVIAFSLGRGAFQHIHPNALSLKDHQVPTLLGTNISPRNALFSR